MGLEVCTWMGYMVSCLDILMIQVVFFVRASIEISSIGHYVGIL